MIEPAGIEALDVHSALTETKPQRQLTSVQWQQPTVDLFVTVPVAIWTTSLIKWIPVILIPGWQLLKSFELLEAEFSAGTDL